MSVGLVCARCIFDIYVYVIFVDTQLWLLSLKLIGNWINLTSPNQMEHGGSAICQFGLASQQRFDCVLNKQFAIDCCVFVNHRFLCDWKNCSQRENKNEVQVHVSKWPLRIDRFLGIFIICIRCFNLLRKYRLTPVIVLKNDCFLKAPASAWPYSLRTLQFWEYLDEMEF